MTPKRGIGVNLIHLFRCFSGAILFEVDVFSDPDPGVAKCVGEKLNPPLRLAQVKIVQVDIEKVDVPRHLYLGHNVLLHDFARDWKRRTLGVVVYVSVTGALEFPVLLSEQLPE